MIPPVIIDYGTDADAGSWLEALAYVHFPWGDFKPAHQGADRLSDSDGPAGSLTPFHEPTASAGGAKEHA